MLRMFARVPVLTVLLALLFSTAGLVSAAPAAPGPEWPFWRLNAQNIARQSGHGNITTPALKWTIPGTGMPNPFISDLTGNGKQDYLITVDGRLIARDALGNDLWITDLIGNVSVIGAVDLDGDGTKDVVVRDNVGRYQGRVTTLNGKTGSVEWRSSYFGTNFAARIVNFNTIAISNTLSELLIQPEAGSTQILSFAGSPVSPTVVFSATVPGNNLSQAVGNLNPTSYPSLVTLSDSGTIRVYNNDGSLLGESASFGGALYSTPILADTNGDGRTDITVIASASNSQAGVLVADVSPTGTITARWSHLYPAGSNAYAISVGNNAVGQFQAGITTTTQVLAGLYNDDGAGRTDTVLFDGATGNRLLTLSGEYPVAAFDVDGDKSPEIVTSNGGRVTVWKYTGTATPATVLQVNNATLAYNRPLNLDGAPGNELLLQVDSNGDHFYDTLQGIRVGDGGVAYSYPIPPNTQIDVQTVSDVDMNGTPDVVVASSDGFIERLVLSGSTLVLQTPRVRGSDVANPFYVSVLNGGVKIWGRDGAGQGVVFDPAGATLQTPPTQILTTTLATDPRSLLGIYDFGGSVGRALLFADFSNAPNSTLSLQSQTGTVLWTSAFTYPVVSGLQLPTSRLPNRQIGSLLLGQTRGAAPGVTGSILLGQARGTGALDIFLRTYDPTSNSYVLVAVNGENGHVLWDKFFPIKTGEQYMGALGLTDANADGHTDVFTNLGAAGNTQLQAFSGLNGASVFAAQPDPAYFFGTLPPLLTNSSSGKPAVTVSGYGKTVAHWTVDNAAPAYTATNVGVNLYNCCVGAVALNNGTRLGVDLRPNGLLNVRDLDSGSLVYTRTLGIVAGVPTVSNGSAPNMNTDELNEAAVADINGDGNGDILVASDNGYLYALNVQDGSLLWAYNFYSPVRHLAVADLDNSGTLGVLAVTGNGAIHALGQQQLSPAVNVWDGRGTTPANDIQAQVSDTCYSVRWLPVAGASSYRVTLRDQSGAGVHTSDITESDATLGANLRGIDICNLSLVRGRRYFATLIASNGSATSGSSASNGIFVRYAAYLPVLRRNTP